MYMSTCEHMKDNSISNTATFLPSCLQLRVLKAVFQEVVRFANYKKTSVTGAAVIGRRGVGLESFE